ncbi:MAG: DNA polymerase II [Myxococcota bacterium]
MSRHTGFILQPTSTQRSGRPVVQLFGRLRDGAPFLVEDRRFEPYFFAHVGRTGPLAAERGVRIEPTDLRDLRGRPVSRIVARVPGDVPRLRRMIMDAGGEALEADIRFAYRYLIDRGIRAAVEIDGDPERLESGLLRFSDPELSPCEYRPQLSILSVDIETTPDASKVLSIALVGAAIDEVHLVSSKPVAGAQIHASESDLLSAFGARVAEIDPDILTGWNVIDFDVRVLERRARATRTRLELGRVPGPIVFAQDASFTRTSRAEIAGRMVLDGIALVRDAFITLEDYTLETTARQLLGRGKLIHGPLGDRANEIQRLYVDDPAALVAYNREDARLVLDIIEQESLLELAIERSLLCGMQLDRVGASIASFDLLYLPELRRRGYVAPSVDAERKRERVRGGAVMDSHAGLFSNVAVYDFKSLYPSLIRTFDLDPLAHANPGDDPIVAPNGAAFAREGGLLPEILKRFFARREQAKQRGDEHADTAIKIMMNALFGVLGAASCRFFDPDVANAITSFGQQILGWTREEFEQRGVRVLYGDTDSVFVALDPELELGAAGSRARELLELVQQAIAERLEHEYGVGSELVLELERIYARFFQPSVRGGTEGSKKRYAGLVDGQLHVVGLESVRRDWPDVTRRLQHGMLSRVFNDAPVVPFVQEIVKRVTAGELDEELVIRKGLRKGSVERYTERIPPHVEAARRAGSRAGRVVSYVVTDNGPEPVFLGEPMPGNIDYAHYVAKVLRPVAESILSLMGESVEEALGEPQQLSLL